MRPSLTCSRRSCKEPGERSNALWIERTTFLGLGNVTGADARYSVNDPVGVREVAGEPAIGGERTDVDADRNLHTVCVFVVSSRRVEDERYTVGAHAHDAEPQDHVGDASPVVSDVKQIGGL